MNGQQLREWRESKGLTQGQVAEFVNETLMLTEPISGNNIGYYERERQRIPADIAAFFDQIVATPDDVIDGLEIPEPKPRRPRKPKEQDEAPQAPVGSGQQTLPFDPGRTYTQACTELWRIVALGFSGWGMLFQKPVYIDDGKLIDQQAAALGEAWGKAAEQNETLKRWVGSLSEGGVWVQVSIVTGQLAGSLAQNHMVHRELRRQGGLEPQAFVAPEHGPAEQPVAEAYGVPAADGVEIPTFLNE